MCFGATKIGISLRNYSQKYDVCELWMHERTNEWTMKRATYTRHICTCSAPGWRSHEVLPLASTGGLPYQFVAVVVWMYTSILLIYPSTTRKSFSCYSNIYCTWSDKVLYMLFFFFFVLNHLRKYQFVHMVTGWLVGWLVGILNQNKATEKKTFPRNLSKNSRFNLYFCHCSSFDR